MRQALFISAAGMLAVCSGMAFEPPGPQQRLEAIGPTNGLSDVLRRAFTPDDSFEPVPVPGASDWLAVHREPGQTFEQFRRSRPIQPDAHRRIVYLQPLGRFPGTAEPVPGEAPRICGGLLPDGSESPPAGGHQHRRLHQPDQLHDETAPDPDRGCPSLAEREVARRRLLPAGDHHGGPLPGAILELRLRPGIVDRAGWGLQLCALRPRILRRGSRARTTRRCSCGGA